MHESLLLFQAEDGIRDRDVNGVQTCALQISGKGGGRQVKEVTLFTNTANGREMLTLKGIVNKK